MDITQEVKDIIREEFYNRVKPVDHIGVLKILKEIADNSDNFTEFESDFLKEIARLAKRFKEKLRLSKKQYDTLNDIWFSKAFNSIIESKIVSDKK